MADDEETRVRRRLLRLVGAGPAEPAEVPSVPVPHPGDDRGIRATGAGATQPPGSGSFPVAGWPAVRADEGPAAPADGGDVVPAPPVSRLPGPGAFDPGRRGVRALAAVAVVVVLGAGLWAWRSRPDAEPLRPSAPALPETSTLAGAPAVPEATTSPTGELVVAVAGKVRRPGLVRVPAGARVADAVHAAGGALPGVDVALLNPARKVADGELILVGVAAPPGTPA
ncbi:SLBB domain-containing protein, partial [Micromonospora sp. KC723]|uniref:SLBB domain-containing protein n=1 Tax=Micromonospora sp. KC723 TaxID=2530381 RepID=UPI00104DD7B5